MTTLARSLQAGFDPLLGGLAGALGLIGFVAVASASVGYGEWHFGNPWHYNIRHALYLAIALALAAVA